MRWWQNHLDIPLPLQHPLVQDFRLYEAGHKEEAAPVIPPWLFLRWVVMTRTESGTIALVLSMLLWACAACIRFEHIARCETTDWTEQRMFGWCKKGKARVRGARPGFAWAVPRVLNGIDFLKPLFDILHQKDVKAGIFPDVVLRSGAVCATSPITTAAMPYKRFHS